MQFSTGKCATLAPRFCKPVTILKRISSLTYRPRGFKIHLVFHVSCLKERLGFCDNTVITKTLVTSEDLGSKPHVPEKILDVKTNHLHSKTV